MRKIQPASFADLSYREKKKQARREKFLAEMDAILPWKKLLGQIERHYPEGRGGRPPAGVERMLRIYFMQQWYGLSDPAMEENLYDIEALRRFAGVDLSSVPDETTICKFRHFLEEHNLTEKMFEETKSHLDDHGLILNEGMPLPLREFFSVQALRHEEERGQESPVASLPGGSVA